MGECSLLPLHWITPGETIYIIVCLNSAPWSWLVYSLSSHIWWPWFDWRRETILVLMSYGSLQQVIPFTPLSYLANRIKRIKGETPKNSVISRLLEQPQYVNRINFFICPCNCLKYSHDLLKESQSLLAPFNLFQIPGLAYLTRRVVRLYWTLTEEGIGVWSIFYWCGFSLAHSVTGKA